MAVGRSPIKTPHPRGDGSRNTIYPVGPNRYLARNFWAEVSFTRDSARKVSGFGYAIAGQKFEAVRK